jgi:ADP-ribose pyrophosphatase
VVSKTLVFEGRKVSVFKADVKMPSGKTVSREIVAHRGAVAILPLLQDGKVVLEDHYRFVIATELLEVPAGTLDEGEDPAAAARRELEEETGLVAGELIPLGSFYTSPGVLSELMYAYLARHLVRGRRALEDDETIDIVEVPLDEAVQYALSGRIRDAKTIATLFLAQDFLKRESQAGG